MASARYTLDIKEEDLKPEVEPPLTPAEKRANWLHYHKWMLVAIVFGLILVIWFVHDMVTRVDPDYTIALVTVSYIPDETITSLENALSAELEDLNGDGKVVVTVSHYTYRYGDESVNESLDSYQKMAGEVQLSTDLSTSTSILFITDCFDAMEDSTQIFGYLDDPYSYPPEDQRTDYDRMSIRWGDSKLLSSLALEGDITDYTTGKTMPAQQFFADLRVAQRTLYNSKDKSLLRCFDSCVSFMKRVQETE